MYIWCWMLLIRKGCCVIFCKKKKKQRYIVIFHGRMRHHKWNVSWTNSIHFEFFGFFFKEKDQSCFSNRIIYSTFYIINFPFQIQCRVNSERWWENHLKCLQTVSALKPRWQDLKNRNSPIKVKLNDSVSGPLRSVFFPPSQERGNTCHFRTSDSWMEEVCLVLFLDGGKIPSQEA